MKKIVKYLVAAIAMVAAVSCQKELVEEKAPVKDGDSYVFTASLKPATKTVLNIDEETGVMKSQWWAGAKGKEYINVMDDREVNNKYASANLQEAADKTDFSLDEGADFYGTEVFAVYPYHANNAYWKGEEGEIGVVADFKQIQTATSGNYDPTATVHVAYNPDITASTNLVFSNLSALVKFDVTTDFVRTITLSGLNGEMVSGPMVYKYANGKYTLEDNTDGYVEVTLTAAPYDYANGNGNAEQNYFAKGAHYLAIVPGTFEKGIQITLNAGLENPITFTHNDPITLRPGTVNDFGAFGTDKNLDWGVAKVGEEENAHKLEYKDGYFVGIVELTKDESYKIVASQEDYDASNYGLSFPREYAPVGKYDLATGEAGYEIRVDKTGEYDVMFSTGLSVLYLLDKDAADAGDFDLSKVGTPDPVRTIAGGFVGEKAEMTLVTDEDGNGLYYQTVIEFAENATNFTFQILDGIKDQTNPGQFVKYGWEKPEDYDFAEDYDDTITFGTKVGGPAIDAIGAAGLYYIKQSLDGSTITIITTETPDGAQWAFVTRPAGETLTNEDGEPIDEDGNVINYDDFESFQDYMDALVITYPEVNMLVDMTSMFFTVGNEVSEDQYTSLLPFMSGYKIIPTDYNSGEIQLLNVDDEGNITDEVLVIVPYSNLTSTTCDFDLEQIYVYDLVTEESIVTATLIPEEDWITIGAGGWGPLM